MTAHVTRTFNRVGILTLKVVAFVSRRSTQPERKHFHNFMAVHMEGPFKRLGFTAATLAAGNACINPSMLESSSGKCRLAQ